MSVLTRRWFIGGLASSGALAAFPRLFAAAPTATSGRPRLAFGVVSDVHIRLANVATGAFAKGCDPQTLRHAFEYFRDQGVDAVVIPGDMADRGLVGELKAVADAWYATFPNDRAPDGRHVEKLFVFGNHDWNGLRRGKKTIKNDLETLKANAICVDPRKTWRELFHEDWAEVYSKTVNGYLFNCAHWCHQDCRGKDENFNLALGDWYAAHDPKVDPKLPFFHVQHPHPKDTCYGDMVWGQDNGVSRKALANHPNAVSFSGHSHTSITDDTSIWQGAFTSVGCGSLRYTGLTPYAFLPDGFENGWTPKSDQSAAINGLKTMAALGTHGCRQGLVVRVYDDRMVFSRREFMTDQPLGPDWVMPLPAGRPRPFDFASRRAAETPPAFAPGAALRLSTGTAKNRKKQQVPAVFVDIPPAHSSPTRAYHYEVTVAAEGGESKLKRALAQGFNFARTDKQASVDLRFSLAREVLPKGDRLTFTVTPVSSLGTRGRSLSASTELPKENAS